MSIAFVILIYFLEHVLRREVVATPSLDFLYRRPDIPTFDTIVRYGPPLSCLSNDTKMSTIELHMTSRDVRGGSRICKKGEPRSKRGGRVADITRK